MNVKSEHTLFFCILPCWAQNDIAVISSIEELQKVGQFIYFLEDKTENLTLEDVLKSENQARFQRNIKDFFSHPPASAPLWFKITVQNQTQEKIWLHTGDTNDAWYLDFYAPDSMGQYQTPKLLGAFRPQENQEIQSNIYCIRLSTENKPKTYYFRMQSARPKSITFQIGAALPLMEKLNYDQWEKVAFLSVVMAMLLYNLFIYFSTFSKVYLTYILYLLTLPAFVCHAQANPLYYSKWLFENIVVWHGATSFSIALFAVHYLNLRQTLHPYYYYFTWGLTLTICGLMPIVHLMGFDVLDLTSILVFVYALNWIVCSIYL